MRRAGKGTVQRGPTLELYKEALDAFYTREGDVVPGNELVLSGFDPKEHWEVVEACRAGIQFMK